MKKTYWKFITPWPTIKGYNDQRYFSTKQKAYKYAAKRSKHSRGINFMVFELVKSKAVSLKYFRAGKLFRPTPIQPWPPMGWVCLNDDFKVVVRVVDAELGQGESK